MSTKGSKCHKQTWKGDNKTKIRCKGKKVACQAQESACAHAHTQPHMHATMHTITAIDIGRTPTMCQVACYAVKHRGDQSQSPCSPGACTLVGETGIDQVSAQKFVKLQL